jgi:hypothetical protein
MENPGWVTCWSRQSVELLAFAWSFWGVVIGEYLKTRPPQLQFKHIQGHL